MKRLVMLAAALALAWTPSSAQTLTKLKAGMVTGIDQIGLPIALERGFFEKNGLDVTMPPVSTPSTPCRRAKARSCRLACP